MNQALIKNARRCTPRGLLIAITLGLIGLLAAPPAARATNPVPYIDQPLVPDGAHAGNPTGLKLTVHGTGFISSSKVLFNGPLATTFVNSTELTAGVPASALTTIETVSVTVENPGPGGGTSNVVYFPIADARQTTVDYAPVGAGLSVGATGGTVGDFNGDGRLDLASLDSSNSVDVSLGNGDGTFQSAVSFTTAANSVAVIAGDFNNDGKLDLATANSNGTVSILLGNGDGTFGTNVDYPAGLDSFDLVAGDFNGDGTLDLAVVNFTSKTVSILLGNGDGTFQPHVDYATGGGPESIATGDFNGDGKLDLAVSNFSANSVSVLLGNGDGTFQTQVTFGAGTQPRSVLTADFNADGKLDLAVGGVGQTLILLGNGDGTFQPAVAYTGGAFPLVAGDFNSDGKLDIAGAQSVLLGNGDGTFAKAIALPPGTVSGGVAADFNGDGKLDLFFLALRWVSARLCCKPPWSWRGPASALASRRWAPQAHPKPWAC